MTPPRSMSPTSTTGTSAASAKPILAMSPARRLISAGLPAPSTSTRSAVGGEPRERAEHRAAAAIGASARYSRAEALPAAPCRRQHDLRARCPACGFSSTGFMSVRRRDAAGARLQRLGAADLAAVGGDRGVVRHVLRLERPHPQPAPGEGARHSPATISDLPTSEPVPWIISARVTLTLPALAGEAIAATARVGECLRTRR